MTDRPRPPVRLAAAALALLLAVAVPRAVAAQTESLVEILASVVAAEDARRWAPEVFETGVSHPDTMVRARAALAIGRLRDPRGLELLRPLLDDPSPNVAAPAVFALGLVGEPAALPWIAQRLANAPALDVGSALEAMTAIARIGGPDAAAYLNRVLQRNAELVVTDTLSVTRQAALEAWRLGAEMPAQALVGLLQEQDLLLRRNALYSLTRAAAGAPALGQRLVELPLDPSQAIRQLAALGLRRAHAEAAGVPREAAVPLLERLLDDTDLGTRVNALRALGSWRHAPSAGRVAALLDDPIVQAQVQAAEALGQLGGDDAASALAAAAGATRRPYGVRRAALVALGRAAPARVAEVAAPWLASRDWRERLAAAEALGGADEGEGVQPLLADPDPRVAGAALFAWAAADTGAPGDGLVAAARQRLTHRDAVVRAGAATILARVASPGDVPAIVAALRASDRDSTPDAALAALEALLAIHRAPAGREAVASQFLATTVRPDRYLLRRWAEDAWPELAGRWGPAYPLETGRSTLDYRDLVRSTMLPGGRDVRPTVKIEIDGKGVVEVELYGEDAPLTVANFLRLVERRYFDGGRWHRVVPFFVVQDGDPRGDGTGGPGTVIRDEPNRRRFGGSVLGMALAGPDSGGSQWFITLSEQPHLDGTFTAFGRVIAGQATLVRVVQGDVIRSITR